MKVKDHSARLRTAACARMYIVCVIVEVIVRNALALTDHLEKIFRCCGGDLHVAPAHQLQS